MYITNTYCDPTVLSPLVRNRWEFMETGSACAILNSVCPNEWNDIRNFLASYALNPQTWLRRGGNRGGVPIEMDGFFHNLGWGEVRIDLNTEAIFIDRNEQPIGRFPGVYKEGYLVDNYKNGVALDVEWNAKDGNIDRDFSAYRSWHEAGIIKAAVLITQNRLSLKILAETLWANYCAALPPGAPLPPLPIDLSTSTTTNLDKVALRVRRGVMGTCPLLVIAANGNTWNGQPYI